MEANLDIRKLYSPLGIRLSYFEFEKYSTEKISGEIWGINKAYFYYEELIEKIAIEVNRFDPTAVYRITDEYIERIAGVFDKLEHQKIGSSKSKKKFQKIVNEKKRFPFEEWEDELYYYLFHLFTILDVRQDFAEKNDLNFISENPSSILKLPDNFTIPQIKQHFKQALTHQEVTLFMYYLRELRIMPPFEQTQYSKLAPAFFGYHEKTVATDLRDFISQTPSKISLTNLKNIIEDLLARVNDDLTKAKR